jgi:hypothetical protein
VFEDPSVDNLIFICSRTTTPESQIHHQIRVHDIASEDFSKEVQSVRLYPQRNITVPDYVFELDASDEVSHLLVKVEVGARPFGEIGGAYFGIQTFDRKAFVSSSKRGASYKPVIDGGNVFRYYLAPHHEYLDYRPENIKSGGDPRIYKRERIVVRQIGKYPEGTLCPKGLLTLNTIYNLYTDDPAFDIKYVLAILNSRLTQFYWLARFYDNKETFPKIKKQPLHSIPIKIVPLEKQAPIIALVDKILFAKQANPQAGTSAWEREIDQLVYKLYGLTEEEIKIVEGQT